MQVTKNKFLNKADGLLSKTIVSFGLRVVGLGVNLLFFWLITRLFGPSGTGIYSTALALVVVAGGVLALGTDTIILKLAGQYMGQPGSVAFRQNFKSMYGSIALISLVISLFLYFSLPYIAGFYSDGTLHALRLASLCLPLHVLHLLQVQFLKGLSKITPSQVGEHIARPAGMLLFFGILHYNGVANAFIYAIPLGVLLAWVVSFFMALPVYVGLPYYKQKTNLNQRTQLLRNAWPMFFTTVSFTIISYTDVFMLGYYDLMADVGLYSAAVRISQLVVLVISSINTISAPRYAQYFDEGNTQKYHETVRTSAKLLFFGSIPFIIGLAIGAPYILQILGKGQEFRASAVPLYILLSGQAINALAGSVGIILSMTGREKVFRNIIMASMLLNVILNTLLIPKWGMAGAALATGFTTIVWNVTAAAYLFVKDGLKSFYIPFVK